MEIGTTAQSINWKTKIISGVIFATVMVPTLYLIHNFILDEEKSVSYYLVQGLVFGIIMGFIFPWITQKLGNKAADKLAQSIKVDLNNDESIEFEGPANLFRGIEGVGGKLFLTDQKLIFVSHKFNIQKGQTDISYKDIINIESRKTANLIDNGIRITTKASKSYDFVVNDRDQWMFILKRKIK